MSMKRETLGANERRSAAARSWVGAAAHNLKLDDDLAERFCEHIAEGLPPETAADLLGISPRTFDRWKDAGRAFDQNGKPAAHAIYARFDRAYRLARATFLRRLILEALDARTKPLRGRLLLEVLRRRDRASWSVPREEAGPDDWADGMNPDHAYL